MSEKMKQEMIIEKCRTILDHDLEIVAAFLFGSSASGVVHRRSDVDVAIYFNNLQDFRDFAREVNTFIESHQR